MWGEVYILGHFVITVNLYYLDDSVPELFLVLLEVPDPAPVIPTLVLAVCSGRLMLPVSVLA